MKRKVKFLGFMFIMVFTVLGLMLVLPTAQATNQNLKTIEYYQKSFYDELDDGWISFFEINYPTTEGENTYIFDAFNLKYKELDGYYVPVIDNETKKEIDRIIPEYITLSISEKYREEIKDINKFFNEKQFINEIKISDLDKLEIVEISKEYLVTIFNKAINSELKTTPGEYYDSYSSGKVSVESTDKSLEGEWQLTYIINYGKIKKVNIEFISSDGKYLSDEVESKTALNKDIKLVEELEQLEKNIVINQHNIFNKNTNNSISSENKDINNLLLEFEKLLNE